MPNSSISQKRAELLAMLYTYSMVRDCVAGEAAVKRQDELYLPMPSGMVDAVQPSIGSSNRQILGPNGLTQEQYNSVEFNPNYHTNPAYAAYKTRASVPDLTGFTLRSLMGLALRKNASIDLPDKLALLEQQLPHMYRRTLSEVLQTGRYGILIDIVDDEFVLVPYVAESIINWKVQRDVNGKLVSYEYIILEETVCKEEDYSVETEKRYRVLEVVDGVYRSTLYTDEGTPIPPADQEGEELVTYVEPNYKGKTLDKVPFVFFGSTDNDSEPDVSPLAAIAAITIQVYMKSADLSQAEYTSCNPTLVFSGIQGDQVPKKIGATVAIALPDKEAKAYYTTTDTSALDHVQGHIAALYEQAVVYGAQLLGGSKSGVESGEALRLRQSAGSSSLVTVVTTIQNGYEMLFSLVGEWGGMSEDQFEFEPIKEFSEMQLSAQEMVALVNSWMNGVLSKETVVDVFRRAGMLKDDRTVEDELKAIADSGGQIPMSNGAGSAEGDE